MNQRRPTALPYLVALGVLWVVPLLLVVVLHLTLPKHNSGDQCEGIGFGCVPAPADGVLLVGMMAAPALFVAGLVACAAIAGWRWARMNRRHHYGG